MDEVMKKMPRLFYNLPNKVELEKWIRSFSGSNDCNSGTEPASLERLMSYWEKAKGEYLYKMLGETFIVRKPYTTAQSVSELSDIIFDKCHRLENDDMYKFATEYNKWVSNTDYEWKIKVRLKRLTDSDVLASNVYNDATIKINVNGTDIAIQRGCKATKVLGKIAHAAGLEFEAFRLEHSRILNKKELKGTLCISIHPLDYITMSDNTYGWDSCMNWRDSGCYRMGTVEMMNSPCVVVAYFTGNKTMRFYDCEWNSKKWRNLFIVDKDYVMSIKGYPYQSTEMDEAAIGMIKELAKKNLGWTYGNEVYEWEFNNNHDDVSLDADGDEQVYFEFDTNYMYNDFGNSNISHFILSPTHGNDYYMLYSGVAECMHCGNIVGRDCQINDADSLVCQDCLIFYTCEHCEDNIYNMDAVYELDGHTLCETCYYDHREYDPLDNEYHYDGDMRTIYLVDKDAPFIGKSSCGDSDFYKGDMRSIMVLESNLEDYGVQYKTISIHRTSWWSETAYYVVKGEIFDDGRDETDILEAFGEC